jgi:hypothetical protein
MKIGKWHIISDEELKKRQETELELKRRFSPEIIEALKSGSVHLRRNPKRAGR